MTGYIKKVSDRGFLFIERPGEPDLFGHVRDCFFNGEEFDDRLTMRRVMFDVVDGPDGRPRAVNIRFA